MKKTLFLLIGLSLLLSSSFVFFTTIPLNTPDINKSDSLSNKLDSYLSFIGKAKGFNGTVLVSKNQGKDILVNEAFGITNDSTGRKFQKNDIQAIGSITKTFTAGAIFKLVEEGTISLDTQLKDVFTDIDQQKKFITIKQLVNHLSGLPSDFGLDTDTFSKKKLKKILFNTDLEQNPGEGYIYSNTGYAFLALVIEEVTNKSYFDYVNEVILERLGLDNTGFFGDASLRDHL